MIGIDIVEISRIKELYEKFGERFLSKILGIDEISILRTKKDIFPFIAGRFAAKEAYVKASGNRSVNFNSLNIINSAEGKPFFRDIEDYEVSISHERQYAVAMVIRK